MLQLTGFLLFTRGFFPKKLVLSGYGDYHPPGHGFSSGPVFKKLVLVVIDAFRSDFAYSTNSHMSNLHKLINDGYALPFTAHSTPPTVTLPRIKGLTTGSTPNFLDAVLNIAEEDTSSTLADQDNWLIQMKRQGKKLHMFGDDTWIKLFPGMFDVVDGTASFFVSDYTEVDNNVTRHLDHELGETQLWDVLILHYLGLDHLGHKGGPDSPFMSEKQKEMDDIIFSIFNSIDTDSLMVVCGDHGMNDAGNHGGSSSGETSSVMTLFSHKFSKTLKLDIESPLAVTEDFNYYRRIQQADLVPTLSALLDFPIPKNSLGVVIEDLMPLWPKQHDRLNVLRQNTKQMAVILDSIYGDFKDPATPDAESQMLCESLQDYVHVSDLDELKCLWWRIEENFIEEGAYEFLYGAQKLLSRASSNYNVSDMIYAITLVSLGSIISFGLLCSFDITMTLKLVVTIMVGTYAVSMFGSSLVEEEHHFWYWGTTGLLAWRYIIAARRKFTNGNKWIFCLALHRIIRSWNQTGQKYAGGADIAKFLQSDGKDPFLWAMIFVYYFFLFEKLRKGNFSEINGMAGFVLSFTTTMSSLVFKINMASQAGDVIPKILEHLVIQNGDLETLIGLGRLNFFIVGVGFLYELSKLILHSSRQPTGLTVSNISVLFEVIFVTQSRIYNIPLFLIYNLLKSFLGRAITNSYNEIEKDFSVLTVLFILFLQHVSFFAMGNSNSLASIDLSNAYNGVGSYNMNIVGVLLFVSNWAGPLYWSIAGLSILFNLAPYTTHSLQNLVTTKIIVSQLFFSVATVGIMGACLALKHHLFIWTVFSPKLLYTGSWVIVQHGLIDTLFCSLLLLIP